MAIQQGLGTCFERIIRLFTGGQEEGAHMFRADYKAIHRGSGGGGGGHLFRTDYRDIHRRIRGAKQTSEN